MKLLLENWRQYLKETRNRPPLPASEEYNQEDLRQRGFFREKLKDLLKTVTNADNFKKDFEKSIAAFKESGIDSRRLYDAIVEISLEELDKYEDEKNSSEEQVKQAHNVFFKWTEEQAKRIQAK